ncbi:MAG TPA: Rap1a/Tai family immunity protein [Phenylobacterium sp.]|nr:Rap1a/Tai family immunity protein [Phenylobacterium sp.]
MRWLILITAMAGLSPPAPSIHGFMDSAALIATCKAEDAAAPTKTAVCLGYIAGVMDQLMLEQSDLQPEARTICPPPALTVNAAKAAVLRRDGWAVTSRPVGAAGFVKAAFEDAFPCGRTVSGS